MCFCKHFVSIRAHFYLDERPYSPRIWCVSCSHPLSVDCVQFFVYQYSQSRRMYNQPEHFAWDLIPKTRFELKRYSRYGSLIVRGPHPLYTSADQSTRVVGDMRRNELSSLGGHSNCPGDELVSLPQKDGLLNKASSCLAISILYLDLTT